MKARSVTVLLVEDDEVDATSIARAFKKHRIANPMVHAKDGVEALEILRGEKGDDFTLEDPYLILLDLAMPRMNGIEFLEEIRKDPELHRAIVFVLTTSADDEDRIKAYDFNIAGYIVKRDAGKGFLNLIEMLDHYWRVVEFP